MHRFALFIAAKFDIASQCSVPFECDLRDPVYEKVTLENKNVTAVVGNRLLRSHFVLQMPVFYFFFCTRISFVRDFCGCTKTRKLYWRGIRDDMVRLSGSKLGAVFPLQEQTVLMCGPGKFCTFFSLLL